MYTAQPALHDQQKPHIDPARNATRLMLGRVVATHEDTDQLDIALLGGGRLDHVPLLSSAAGRNFGHAALPAVTEGYGTASATGLEDVYAVVGYLRGEAEMPIVLGFIGPKDSNLLKRPAGSNVRRDAGGQLHATFLDGTEEHRWPGDGVLTIGTDQPQTFDPKLLPPSGPATVFNLTNGVGGLLLDSAGLVNITAPGGLLINNHHLTFSADLTFGGYTGGAPAATGYVSLTIGGVVYKLLAST